MGSKLSEKNPNITDLSDSNRPTKIAEKYSELYDNEWTDALETLTSDNGIYTEESAIQVLLTCIQVNIVHHIIHKCLYFAKRNAKKVKVASIQVSIVLYRYYWFIYMYSVYSITCCIQVKNIHRDTT